MKVCRTEQTKYLTSLPVIDIHLDIVPQRQTSMLVDTGAQVSLINNSIIKNPALINTENKITISSIHGSESTLGDISANIISNQANPIPIQLQVTKNKLLKEDGILGYDILGENAIINGPDKILTINSNSSYFKIPIKNHKTNTQINLINIDKEIKEFHNIEYVSFNETNPEYKYNLKKVQSITQEINENQIQIKPLKNSSPEVFKK